MKEENYNFLHGLPTRTVIAFWFHRRKEDKSWHRRMVCSLQSPCEDCTTERRRRNRLLNIEKDPKGAAAKMAEPRFRNCVLITPFNKAVFQFSIHRAQTFALSMGEPLFWMQAVDKPPAWFASTLGKEDLENMKQKWLQYHARKTEGILSLCPCCHGMPMCITSGNSALYREYGVRNGATCVLQAWELDPLDKDTLERSQDAQVVLRALPRKLIVRMDRPLLKQYEGLPSNCFPLAPVTVYWTLDAEDSIEIHRRGFPVVPNFSTTVDGATGKTMDTALPDLGSVSVVPSFTRAMKGYIALSRVRKVDDLWLAQPFSPALFQQGSQPWPTLLLDTLKGHVQEIELEEKAAEAEWRSRKPKLLKDLTWTCDTCSKDTTGDYKKFLNVASTKEEWFDAYWKKIIAPGVTRSCLVCTGEGPAEAPLQCHWCGILPRSAFSKSDLHNVKAQDRRMLWCRECRSPKCTNPGCSTCQVCRDVRCDAQGKCGKELTPVNPANLPKTKKERSAFFGEHV